MPSGSVAQQHFFGYMRAHPGEAKKRGIHMTQAQIADFARTSTKGLPEHVSDRPTASDSLRRRMHGD